jgi:hypothetical protein
MAETKALEPSRLLEKELERKERKEARLAARKAQLATLVEDIKFNAAKVTALRKHAFKPQADLEKLGLSPQEIALVRSWEEPKKTVPFAVESAAKLVEAQVKGQEASKGPQLIVENMTVRLPQKGAEVLPTPVIIEVEAKEK